MNEFGLGAFVALIASCTAALNALGRFGYSTISDKLKDRSTIYSIIFATSVIAMVLSIVSISYVPILIGIIIIIALLICNAGYGGGFSTLPSLLSDKFGMKNVSVIHGFALSAWAWAGLSGNQLGNYTITNYGYVELFLILSILYLVAFLTTIFFIKE